MRYIIPCGSVINTEWNNEWKLCTEPSIHLYTKSSYPACYRDSMPLPLVLEMQMATMAVQLSVDSEHHSSGSHTYTRALSTEPSPNLPPPPILMFYIAIMLVFISFLRSLRLRETLHCTDFSMQWCAYRHIGNKFKTKKFSKKKLEATM